MPRTLSDEDYNKIKRNIIRKLYSNNAFSRGHMLYERLKSGIPAHLTGSVKIVLKDLVKTDLLVYYGKTKYGEAYQLNIKKLKEIEDILHE